MLRYPADDICEMHFRITRKWERWMGVKTR
jgi:hypothetical protein